MKVFDITMAVFASICLIDVVAQDKLEVYKKDSNGTPVKLGYINVYTNSTQAQVSLIGGTRQQAYVSKECKSEAEAFAFMKELADLGYHSMMYYKLSTNRYDISAFKQLP